MSAEVSFTKRAAAELSRCFHNVGIGVSKSKKSAPSSGNSGTSANPDTSGQKPLIGETTHLLAKNGKPGDGHSRGESIQGPITVIKNINSKPLIPVKPSVSPVGTPNRRASKSGQTPPKAPPKTWRARRTNYLLSVARAKYLDELWSDAKFLSKFFYCFSSIDRCVLAQVCKVWRDVLYSNIHYWSGLIPVIHCSELRREMSTHSMKESIVSSTEGPHQSHIISQSSVSSLVSYDDIRYHLYMSIDKRGFDSICLFGATDGDIIDFASKVPPSVLKRFVFGSLRYASVSDKGLEIFLAALGQSIAKLELSGCNEISDSGLWTGIVPRLDTLIILDCINIADETIAAICHMISSLRVLQLQAYHVTDAAMTYFSPTLVRENLRVLQLQHCWELSNQGVVSLAHGLPNLVSLSLSGCSKVNDDAIEVIAEQIRGLKYLDLSWCPRVSDAALEYIACDLSDTLQQLILDRCLHITDIGVGYIATMPRLVHLSLRWIPQIRDFGLQTLCSMRSLKVLSLAGCPQLSVNGLSCLVQMQQLIELELTNSPGATKELIKYLKDNLPLSCNIIT